MKQRQWKIRRTSIEIKEAQRRWDQAYQALLSPTKSISPQLKHAADGLKIGENEFGALREALK